MEWLFDICCKIMSSFGNLIGLSYKEVCVIFNVYVQGAVWLASALLPFIVLVWKLRKGAAVGKIPYLFFTTCYGVFCSFILIFCINRYSLPLNEGFDMCVNDLYFLAKVYSTTYEVVNIYIFVIGWIISIGWNILIAKLILNGKNAISLAAMLVSLISFIAIIITIVDFAF